MLDRRLDHVVAVAQHGSLTKAAEQVGITQSGMTKSIAVLERDLGFPLFYRTARGVLLTEAGRDFVDRAVSLIEDLKALLPDEQTKVDPFARSLRIGVCPASLEWMLAEPLALLLSHHPPIRFEVLGTTFERGIQLLRTGAVDVAIGFEDAFSEWTEISRERIGSLHAEPFVRQGHPILAMEAPTFGDLAKFNFVIPSDSRPYGRTIRAIFEDAGIDDWRRRVHVIDNFPVVKRIIQSTDSIGVTTAAYVGTKAFNISYARVPCRSPFAPASMCCAFRSRWEPAPAVRAFINIMRDRVPVEA